MQRLFKLVLVLSSIAVLTACVAAAVPMLVGYGAVVGFAGYKWVQATTGGGKLETQIDDTKLTAEERQELRSIKRLAVWPSPGKSSSVDFTEELTTQGRFAPVSPLRVSQAIKRAGASESVDQMTDRELKELSDVVCQETGADAVVVARVGATESNTNMFSLKSAEMVTTGTVMIIMRGRGLQPIKIPIRLVLEVGSGKQQDDREINRLAGRAIAKRLGELST
jgi:hypothetical protein